MKLTRQSVKLKSVKLTSRVRPMNTANVKKLASFAAVTFTSIMMATTTHAELIIQSSPVTVATTTTMAQQPATLINPLQHQPSEASLDKLINVLHIDSMIDELIAQRQQAANVIKGLPSEFPIDNNAGILSRHAQKQIKNIFTKYGAILGQQLEQPTSKQQLQQAYKAIAKKTYTQAEVNALNQFYDTPMGQSILTKQSQVAREFVQVMMPSMIGGNRELEQVLPGLQNDIEKIFK